ncbi:MAG TPA: NAD(+)/NADH kinase, partial [Solirubrobacteraceae bacterium]|nr:NAD(+)/NADH kinase [Solirubrobacteraceae bacterium]
MREMTVFTHRRPDDTVPALGLLAERAAQAGVTLRLDEEETRKHALAAGPGLALDAPAKDDVELCIVLG